MVNAATGHQVRRYSADGRYVEARWETSSTVVLYATAPGGDSIGPIRCTLKGVCERIRHGGRMGVVIEPLPAT